MATTSPTASTTLDAIRRCTFAVDLGANRVRVHRRDRGTVVDDPAVVAVDLRTGEITAAGAEAEEMVGRMPEHLTAERPLVRGEVIDVRLAERMLRRLLAPQLRALRLRPGAARAVVAVPHGGRPVARQAAEAALVEAGLRRVVAVDDLTAAAVGCGFPLDRAEAALLVHCGPDVTRIGLLSLGGVVAAESVPVGGETVLGVIHAHVRARHGIQLPGGAARSVYRTLADPEAAETPVRGRDTADGLPRTAEVDCDRLRREAAAPLEPVVAAVGQVLRRCPPELVADLGERGICLIGENAALPGLAARLAEATGMAVRTAEDPGRCVLRGLAAMVDGRVRQADFSGA